MPSVLLRVKHEQTILLLFPEKCFDKNVFASLNGASFPCLNIINHSRIRKFAIANDE